MTKLIEAFRKMPSPGNRAKLEKHMTKHPMAACMCLPDEVAFLRVHGFSI